MSNLSSVPGTNVPPVSFPGIASGIDYNSIIQKLTSMTLQPTVSLNAQIATLNAANAELIKINGMLSSVQNALLALSQPSIYGAVDALSSDGNAATAQSISGASANAGTYFIQQTQLATATQVLGAAAIGHSELDGIGGTPAWQVPLANSYAAITPSNGSGPTGSITINGVSVTYNVSTDSLQTIFNKINAAVQTATGDASFNIGFAGATDTVQITDANNPISLGAPTDQGNLLQVLRLDQAAVNNTATSGSVTGTAGVGGVDQGLAFNSVNGSGQATNANYTTPVTGGYFTINGVKITIDAANDNLASVIKRINASTAGVVAAYNSATGQISITAKNTGPQSVVLGSGSDTSNFLSATGLTAASGAATTLGTQAFVKIQPPSGPAQTVYSNSNTITTAIPGVQLNLVSNTSTPFQVTVSQSTTQLVSALNTFVSAYNSAISEINTATAPPVVTTAPVGSGIGGSSSQSVGGGILYGNSDVDTIKDQLVNIVSSLNANNDPVYNSLSSIGLNLTSSFTQLVQSSDSGSTSTGSASSTIQTQSMAGTDGELQPLDPQALQNALASNPTAVQNLFNGAQGMVTQLGTYLTGVTGFPTNVSTGLLGTIPRTSLIQNFENANSDQISSIQQQVSLIRDNANQQADALRAEFVATETQLAGFQALQSQLSSFFNQNASGG